MPRNYTIKECEWCNSLFSASRCDARYCSSSCRSHHHRHTKLLDSNVQSTLFSILDMAVAEYANALNQLSPEEIMSTAQAILTETPEQRSNRKQSMLYKLLNKDSQNA